LKTTPSALSFKTDGSIAAFWSKQDHERRAIWGRRLDLERGEPNDE
jgi:hypothetical protein